MGSPASWASRSTASGKLSPSFSTDEVAYRVVLAPGMTTTTVAPSVANPARMTIAVDGRVVPSGTPIPVALGVGFASGTVRIVVTAESGASRTYTISAVRGSTYAKASNTGSGDRFGYAVALSADGRTLAVGADLEDSATTGINGEPENNAANDSGAVFVFRRDAGLAWVQEAYVKALNANAGDGFGFAVGLSADGSTLAVGAPFESSSATGVEGDQASNAASLSGAVYVFRRSADGVWAQEAYVKASNTDDSDRFGYAVALSGDGVTLAVGAIGEDSSATGINGDQTSNLVSFAGAVYVF